MQNTPAAPSSEPTQPQAVRFASVNQEIEPEQNLQATTTPASDANTLGSNELSPGAHAEIRQLSQGLQDVHLQHNMQHRRMINYAYEPVSLPASRVSN